jgi:hypothetical protein
LPTHIERSGDLLTIQQDVPWLSRLLMLPLLLGAGYLFRIFFLSIGDVIGGVKETELLAGQIICLVLGLLVGVPGLMGFLIRNSLGDRQGAGQGDEVLRLQAVQNTQEL